MKTNFSASPPYTVGIEEEFQLIDPSSLALVPAIEDTLAAREAAGISADLVTSELFASCIEARSPVCDTVAELAMEVPILRRRVRNLVESCGAQLGAAGAHPFSEATAQAITSGEHYYRLVDELSWVVRMQATYGLHIHVAVPDEEYAIRAVNALSRHVPIFIALSANSPFWRGADTRLSSVRSMVLGLGPRSGLPPCFHSWEDFVSYVGALVGAGSLPDYSWCWWDVRPHPKFGTVELRAPDMPTDFAGTVSLAALAQCLVATADEHPAENPRFTEENRWRAARYGLDACLHDFSTDRSATARDAARDLVEALRHTSQDLGCEAELESVVRIVEGGNGAESQRAVFRKRRSLKDVVRHLVAMTI